MRSIHRQMVNCNSYAKVPSPIQRTAFQQSHLILNGWCRLFNNSMANITYLCQIPVNESTSAARTSASSSSSFVFRVHKKSHVRILVTTLAIQATGISVLVRCPHFYFGFSVFAGPCDKFPCTSSLVLSLLVDAGYSVGVTVSCNEDVGEVGEDEVEELVDGTLDNEWHLVLRKTLIFAVLDEVGNRPVVSLIRSLRRVSTNKIAVVPNFALYPRCPKRNRVFASCSASVCFACAVCSGICENSLPIRR